MSATGREGGGAGAVASSWGNQKNDLQRTSQENLHTRVVYNAARILSSAGVHFMTRGGLSRDKLFAGAAQLRRRSPFRSRFGEETPGGKVLGQFALHCETSFQRFVRPILLERDDH